ncbi:adenylate/guanylate cyclase domain-containing protein [Microvirga sp. CF3062]|uniref:adenylate/guanylate cyclase domain-containing protein n=1 Tax=Microvirga sp. CF3062 TaxID=3110182 RepID=UPI002E779CF3|nr:adenylate/guanylate cyclase domain-containing protein [Microvirga sp. CF3062]MEE1656003.1 adenylate/guanylate cyclase domain-containing protein [Microvirga sp. CF3062]
MKRKVAAILAADIVGFSRLIAEDEDGTLQQLAAYRNVLDDFVAHHRGRVFNTAGDSIMCEFDSAVEATRAAIDIQDYMRAQNLTSAQNKRLQFRIGISVGEVVERQNDLLGMAVNIAARLETLASPGGICLSRAVHEAVCGHIAVPFVDIGERQVKNIPFPVHAFTIVGPGAEILSEPQRSPLRILAMSSLTIAGACLIVLIGSGGLVSHDQPSRSMEQLTAEAGVLSPIPPGARAPLLPADPIGVFSGLVQRGGQVDDPHSAPGLYHNALLFEAKGESIGAHRAYYTLARMGLEFVDPHLRYAALVRAHEGRFIARQVYGELNEDMPTRATALVHILQFDGAERKARLNALIEKHPDYAPAYFFLAEEHSEDRVGSLQTAQDRRVEQAALAEFLKAHDEGRLMPFFLDQSVAADWVDRAYSRHARLTLSGESVSALPVFEP